MGAAVKRVRGQGRSTRPSKAAKRQVSSPLDRAAGFEVAWSEVSDLFDAARRIQNCQFVYFIGEDDDGPVKIGVAKDPITRLRAMQTGNPRRLRIEHVLVGDMAVEKLLHELWEPHAIVSRRNHGKPGAPPGTEWFEPTVRAELFPIVVKAAAEQVRFLEDAAGDELGFDSLELLVRQAHIAAGFVAKGRDETRLLGAVGGYVISRPSRI